MGQPLITTKSLGSLLHMLFLTIQSTIFVIEFFFEERFNLQSFINIILRFNQRLYENANELKHLISLRKSKSVIKIVAVSELLDSLRDHKNCCV